MIKILDSTKLSSEQIFARVSPTDSVETIVKDIILNVVNQGDSALLDYAKQFDKVELTSLKVTQEEFEKAFCLVEKKLISVLEKAYENVKEFHQKQVRSVF